MKLKIGTPCAENWDTMTPNEKGRFCQKCEKSVFDLTGSTDQEILNFFKTKEEKVCGRLTRFQLNHDFYEAKISQSNSFNKYFAASVALLSLTPAVLAQTNDLNITTPIYAQIDSKSVHESPLKQKTYDVVLKLKDQNGNLIVNANVSVNGQKEVYKTDSLGIVKIDFPENFSEKKVTIYIMAQYGQTGEISLDISNLPVQKEINVELYQEMLMGDIDINYEENIHKIESPAKKK